MIFKPVAGGWIYRAPNKWVFGDAPHYFVTDEQKAKIEALIIPPFWAAYFAAILVLGIFVWTFLVKGMVSVFYGHLDDARKAQIEATFMPRRPRLLAALRLGGAGAWMFAVANIVEVFSGNDEWSTANLFGIAVLFAISLVPVANWLRRRRLEPILAGLPLTRERITRAEMPALRDAAQPDALSKRRAEWREYMRARLQRRLPSTARGEEGLARLLELELLRRGYFNGPIDHVGDDTTHRA